MNENETATQEAPAQDASAAPVLDAPMLQKAAPVALEEAAAPAATPSPKDEQMTPEQLARRRAQQAQKALDDMIAEREDKAATEIREVCAKYGVDLVVGHSVKIQFNRGGVKPVEPG